MSSRAWLVAVLFLGACISSTGLTPTTEIRDTGLVTTAAPPPPEHQIGVRTVEGSGEFFHRITGERFVPRGVNLVRLSGGNHSTLDVGSYDPVAIEADLTGIEEIGFNVVRVFLNTRPGGITGDRMSLSQEYLDNAADFLARAKRHNLRVLFTQDWLPENNSWSFPSDPNIDNVNSMYLSVGGVETNREYYRQWIQGLIDRRADLDAVFAYELRNELYFTNLHAPFSLTQGVVATANGRTYSLTNEAEKRRLLEENLVYWIDEMRATILELDPTALVTIGFFQPQSPNVSRVGDDRLIETQMAILESSADFIDLHGYPGGELNLAQVVENFGLPPVTEKPILLGEFGAEHGPYPHISDAVRALVDWQVESCSHGFDGWLLWTWDTHEQPEFWTGIDEDEYIAHALSPQTRPDPCVIGDLDLALDLSAQASATASSQLGDSPPDNAIDGLPATIWNAGGGPGQWIELDLGDHYTIESIRLLVAQDPAGLTAHRVFVRGPADEALIASFEQSTVDGDWLEVPITTPLEAIRFIRIETLASPSWVAWREISVLGSTS